MLRHLAKVLHLDVFVAVVPHTELLDDDLASILGLVTGLAERQVCALARSRTMWRAHVMRVVVAAHPLCGKGLVDALLNGAVAFGLVGRASGQGLADWCSHRDVDGGSGGDHNKL